MTDSTCTFFYFGQVADLVLGPGQEVAPDRGGYSCHPHLCLFRYLGHPLGIGARKQLTQASFHTVQRRWRLEKPRRLRAYWYHQWYLPSHRRGCRRAYV